MITLVKKEHTYIGKDKTEKKGYNFYIVFNNTWICVKPTFSNDYQKFVMLATDYNDFESK